MNYLKDLTNEQLKACLLDDMESYRNGRRILQDDNIDETASCIEEVFRRIDVYSREKV